MGRPKKEAHEHRRHVVSFRLTDEEMGRLERAAANAGSVPNELARLKVTGGGAQIRPQSRAVREVSLPPEVRQELRRVGVNLNQIARRLNALGEHEPRELAEVSQRMDEVLTRILVGLTPPAC